MHLMQPAKHPNSIARATAQTLLTFTETRVGRTETLLLSHSAVVVLFAPKSKVSPNPSHTDTDDCHC